MRLQAPLVAALVLSGCRALIGIQDPPPADGGSQGGNDGAPAGNDAGDAGTTADCGADGNLILDPGFECHSSITPESAPWYVEFQGVQDAEVTEPNPTSIEMTRSTAHGGSDDAYIEGPEGGTYLWTAVAQDVPLAPNTSYTLTAWIETSSDFGTDTVYVGVQQGMQTPIAQQSPVGSPGYEKVVVGPFDSGAGGQATVFAGYWSPPPSSWMRVDDVSLVAQ